MKILEIGSGKRPIKREGCEVILDKEELEDVEVVWDLNQFPILKRIGEFDEIIAIRALEHLSDLNLVMKELHRILKEGGRLKIVVPHFSHPCAYTDPTHKHFFTLSSFDFYDESTELGKEFNFRSDVKFKIRKVKAIFRPKTFGITVKSKKFWMVYEGIFSRFIPIHSIYFELEKIS